MSGLNWKVNKSFREVVQRFFTSRTSFHNIYDPTLLLCAKTFWVSPAFNGCIRVLQDCRISVQLSRVCLIRVFSGRLVEQTLGFWGRLEDGSSGEAGWTSSWGLRTGHNALCPCLCCVWLFYSGLALSEGGARWANRRQRRSLLTQHSIVWLTSAPSGPQLSAHQRKAARSHASDR